MSSFEPLKEQILLSITISARNRNRWNGSNKWETVNFDYTCMKNFQTLPIIWVSGNFTGALKTNINNTGNIQQNSKTSKYVNAPYALYVEIFIFIRKFDCYLITVQMFLIWLFTKLKKKK